MNMLQLKTLSKEYKLQAKPWITPGTSPRPLKRKTSLTIKWNCIHEELTIKIVAL